MAFRMDSQEQRLLVSDEPGETLAFMGWEVGARDDLETLAAKLDAAGTPVHIGTRELADRRLVQDLIWFLDPMDNPSLSKTMARGIFKGAAFFSNMTDCTPYAVNSKPAVSPVGPDPTMTSGTVLG